MPIISGAKMDITAPITAITSIPIPMVMYAKLLVRSRRLAPMLWPTSVVAASPMPNPGM